LQTRRYTFTIARKPDRSYVFCMYDGSQWREVSNAGVAPAEEVNYRLRLVLNFRTARPTISYSVLGGSGWGELSDADGNTAFPVSSTVSEIVFSGFGEFADLNGDYGPDAGFGIILR